MTDALAGARDKSKPLKLVDVSRQARHGEPGTEAALLAIERASFYLPSNAEPVLAAGSKAVLAEDFSMVLCSGVTATLAGPDAAAKAALFDCISGLSKLSGGCIIYKGEVISKGLSPRQIAARGIARARHDPGIDGLTVLESVAHAKQEASRNGLAGRMLKLGARAPSRLRFEAGAILDGHGLSFIKNETVSSLSGAQRRRLEIVIAIAESPAPSPSLLLLDGAASGAGHGEAEMFYDYATQIQRMRGLTLLIAEGDINLALGKAGHIYVLDKGKLAAYGTPEQVRSSPWAKKYLTAPGV